MVRCLVVEHRRRLQVVEITLLIVIVEGRLCFLGALLDIPKEILRAFPFSKGKLMRVSHQILDGSGSR